MKIFCVIPAYNERGNLEELSHKLIRILRSLRVPFSILFVIQGTDGSRKLVQKLKNRFSCIDYIYFPEALGIGIAYRTGFKHVDRHTTHILTMDADLNHDPGELYKFLNLLKKENPDIIVGSRFMIGGHFNDKRLWKRCASSCINFIITHVLNIPIHDATSGYRLIKYEVIRKINSQLRENGFPFYMEFIISAHRNGFTIREVSITYAFRKWGKSKMNKFRTLVDYGFFLVRLLINS